MYLLRDASVDLGFRREKWKGLGPGVGGGMRYRGGKWLLNRWVKVIKKPSVHWGELQEEGGHCKSRYSYKSENFTDE